jgi:predicted nucleic-acid-binding protein
MIALDTNLIVRIIVKDDEEQLSLVRHLIAHCKETDKRCLVTIAVLCELQWVLLKIYKASRRELADVVEMLLEDEVFVVEEAERVGRALERFRSGKADLSDYLIGERGGALGAESTFTFDKALDGEGGFTLLTQAALQKAV